MSSEEIQKPQYTESEIRSLDWKEHIRLRPGMYIGKLGNGASADDGIYILLKEILDNSVDEYVMGNGKKIEITAEKDPSLLPWEKLNVEVVLESTGKFTKEEDAKKHITAGAKKVIISAPATGNIKSIVMGVNESILDGSELVISNASCTTNNAAPMIALIDKSFEIEDAYVTTVHAYTGDQNIHDGPHKDLRRARGASQSIIPTSTGAAKAITKILNKSQKNPSTEDLPSGD
jgi:glyceraldehyde-3-phosphate dehydrogenase type I